MTILLAVVAGVLAGLLFGRWQADRGMWVAYRDSLQAHSSEICDLRARLDDRDKLFAESLRPGITRALEPPQTRKEPSEKTIPEDKVDPMPAL